MTQNIKAFYVHDCGCIFMELDSGLENIKKCENKVHTDTKSKVSNEDFIKAVLKYLAEQN